MLFSLVLTMGLCSVAAVSALQTVNADGASADFQMETGASVRLDENKPGIRWTANLDESYYNSIKDEIAEVYTMVNKVGADESKAVKISHTTTPTFTDGKATFRAVIPYELGESEGQLTQEEFNKAVGVELTATSYVMLNDNRVITATEAAGTGVNRTMLGVANYHQLLNPTLSEDLLTILRTYVGEATKVEGAAYFDGATYFGGALNASGDVYVNAYKVGTAINGQITFNGGFDVGLVEGTSYKLSVIKEDKTVVYTDATYVDSVYQTDATGMFDYVYSETTSIEKMNKEGVAGYEITAVGGTKISYNQPIELNNAEQDIFKFTTSTPSDLADIIIRFTDYYDPTKGAAIRMVNTDSTAYGWDNGATYIRSGNATDTFSDDFGSYTPIVNDAGKLGSGSANILMRFDGAADSKFSIYIPGSNYYHLKHTGDANVFSDGNTTCKVNVSIEFLNNNTPAKMFVSNIGSDVQPDVVYETDETGMFTHIEDETTVITKKTVGAVAGYEITAVGETKISYNQPIELNNPNADIFKFTTSTPSNLADIIIRFTDYYDPTKGAAIRMVNTDSTAYGWDNGATYIRSGNATDTFSDDFGSYTPITNDAGKLGSGSANILMRFDGAADSKFSIYIPGSNYYHLKHTGDANVFSDGNTTCKVNVSIEFLNNNSAATIFVTNIGSDFIPEVVYETDASGNFTYVKDGGVSIAQQSTGYAINTTASGLKIDYNTAIELNKGEGVTVFALNTSTVSNLTKVIVRFTDYYDSTKGVAIAMVNTVSTDFGWGAAGATYARSGNIDDTFTDDIGGWTPVSNVLAYLGGGSANTWAMSFNAAGEGNKFFVYLPDPIASQYYPLKHTGDVSLFSEENTTYKVKVSIEIITNGQPTSILVSNVGGDFFPAA